MHFGEAIEPDERRVADRVDDRIEDAPFAADDAEALRSASAIRTSRRIGQIIVASGGVTYSRLSCRLSSRTTFFKC
jgi:hypothetical protein